MKTEDLGETYPVAPCPECETEAYYHLVKIEGRKRVKLPILGSVPTPTPSKTRFRLACPYCENSIGLDGSDIEEAKVMLKSTQVYIDGELPDDEYGERLSVFNEVLEEGLENKGFSGWLR